MAEILRRLGLWPAVPPVNTPDAAERERRLARSELRIDHIHALASGGRVPRIATNGWDGTERRHGERRQAAG